MKKAIQIPGSVENQYQPSFWSFRHYNGSRRLVFGSIVSLSCFLWWWYRSIILPDIKSSFTIASNRNENDVNWNNIEASESLRWSPCLDRFLCARLTLPLDSNRPLNASQDHPKVNIALMMLPGVNHTHPSEFSKSPLLLNPGGPGGSGIWMMRTWGDRARKVTSHDQDVIGFDPRGIGESTPRVDCFLIPGDGVLDDGRGSQSLFNRIIWEAAGLNGGLINLSSDDALINRDERTKTLAKLCKSKDTLYAENSIMRHVNTINVVKDMLGIIEAWNAWTSYNKTSQPLPNDLIVEEPIKLNFWGFSYGTLLGSTFAALYPDRVGRMVLDGILNADDYINYAWTAHTKHIDAVLASFFHYCFVAKESCHLYRRGFTATEIRTRFHDIMNKLNQDSITLIYPKTMMPAIINFADLKEYIFEAMFRPMEMFPSLARLLDAIDRGDEYSITSEIQSSALFNAKNLCSTGKGSFDIKEAGLAVSCSDKKYPMNQMIGCRHWNISATGPGLPFDTPSGTFRHEPINTSFPLLFISTSDDPVGPIRGGLNMALKFRHAGFIEQKSEGHCSTSVLSHCTLNKVRSYFQDGIVPPSPVLGKTLPEGQWDRCERDEWPWKPFDRQRWVEAMEQLQSNGQEKRASFKDTTRSIENEADLLQSWKEIQKEGRETFVHRL